MDLDMLKVMIMKKRIIKLDMMSINVSNTSLMLNLSLAEPAVNILWRQGADDEFISTGLLEYINPDTGRPLPNPQVQLPIQDGDVRFEVKYVTPAGEEMGPFDLSFNALELGRARAKDLLENFWTSWIEFGDFNNGCLVYFTHLMSYRIALKSIRYKLDDDENWTGFPVKQGKSLRNTYSISDNTLTYITCPTTTDRIRVQVEYYDGTWSAVHEYKNPARDNE